MSYLQFQRLDVVQQKCENEKDAERLAGEKTEMTDKYDSLKSTLETSRSSMMQVKKKTQAYVYLIELVREKKLRWCNTLKSVGIYLWTYY